MTDKTTIAHIFQRRLLSQDPNTWEPLWGFAFDKNPVEDIEGRPDDGVKGNLKFENGDRIAYHSAYIFLAHEDPGHHDYLHGFRFAFTSVGPINAQINDKYMGELSPQGLVPYPYDGDLTPAVLEGLPGGEIRFFHHRPDAPKKQALQLMGTYTIPAVSPQNEKVRWLYQLNGAWLAVHDEYGPVAHLIVTSLHPRYTLRREELP